MATSTKSRGRWQINTILTHYPRSNFLMLITLKRISLSTHHEFHCKIGFRQQLGEMDPLRLPGSKPLSSKRDTNQLHLWLAIISMQDKGGDVRDQFDELEDLMKEAKRVRIDPVPYLKEIAALSSKVKVEGFGSMQGLFQRFSKKSHNRKGKNKEEEAKTGRNRGDLLEVE